MWRRAAGVAGKASGGVSPSVVLLQTCLNSPGFRASFVMWTAPPMALRAWVRAEGRLWRERSFAYPGAQWHSPTLPQSEGFLNIFFFFFELCKLWKMGFIRGQKKQRQTESPQVWLDVCAHVCTWFVMALEENLLRLMDLSDSLALVADECVCVCVEHLHYAWITIYTDSLG